MPSSLPPSPVDSLISHKKEKLSWLNKRSGYKKLLPIALFILFIPTCLYFIRIEPYLEPTPRIPYQYPPLVKYSYQWSSSNNKDDTVIHSNVYNQDDDKDIYSKIDQKYCKRDRCRFLLPVAITEQESKAQLHFRHLAFLAGKLDRTIVLPNVYKSHLGSCLANSFEFYYDKAWLDKNRAYFNYITMDDFKAWLSERQDSGVIPTAQEVYVQGTRKSTLLTKVKNCFHSFFNFNGRPIVNYQFLDTQKHNVTQMTNIMTSILSDEARQHEYYYDYVGDHNAKTIPPVDVIHLYYDRRYRIITDRPAQKPLDYAQRWVNTANTIVSQLKPFVAIHWRMERLEPVSNLMPCAKNLVSQINDLQASASMTNVFLLTDYPHLLNTTGAKPESSSFQYKQLKPEHHEAIQYLYQHLNISLTSIDNTRIPYNELPTESWHILPIDASPNEQPNAVTDRSVLGIVDKLIAMKAQWFFAGKPGVCAKSSSFTARISNNRLEAFKQGDEHILLPIKMFDNKL